MERKNPVFIFAGILISHFSTSVTDKETSLAVAPKICKLSWKKLILSALITIGFFSISSIAVGQTTRYWVGGAGALFTANSSWSTSLGGAGNGAPVAGDYLIMDGSDISSVAGLQTGSVIITNVPNQNIGRITLQNNANTTLNSGGTTLNIINNTGTDLVLNTGSTLTLGASVNITLATPATATISGTLQIGGGRTYTTSGANSVTTVTATGIINNSGTITAGATKLFFNSGSAYNHTQNGGAIPTATWDPNSNCNITGIVGNSPSGLGQDFGNFSWNSTGQNAAVSVSGLDGNTLGGNFSMISTGTGSVQLVTSNTSRSFIVNGNFSISGGTLNLSAGGGTGTINIIGNFSMTGGTITETSSGSGSIVFDGTLVQNFVKTGGTNSNNIDFSVNNGATLDMSTYVLDGTSSTFTLSSGASLKTGHAQGISSSGSTGSIQVGGARSFNTGANYEYNGAVTQSTGSGLPTTVNNLTFNNSAGFNLTSNVTVSNTLTMTAGNISTGANILALSNPLVGSFTRTTGTVIGKFKRTINTTLLTDYIFPVGTSSFYNPQ